MAAKNIKKTQTPDVTIQEQKPCISCGESINPGASKCPKCRSFQGWRRHIDFGNSTIPLAISIIALLGHFGTIWNYINRLTPAIQPQNADITILELGWDEIRVLVNNRTDGTVFISRISCMFDAFAFPKEVSVGIMHSESAVIDTSSYGVIGYFVLDFQFEYTRTIPPLEPLVLSSLSSTISAPTTKSIHYEQDRVNACAIYGIYGDGREVTNVLDLGLYERLRFNVVALLRENPNASLSETDIQALGEELLPYWDERAILPRNQVSTTAD